MAGVWRVLEAKFKLIPPHFAWLHAPMSFGDNSTQGTNIYDNRYG